MMKVKRRTELLQRLWVVQVDRSIRLWVVQRGDRSIRLWVVQVDRSIRLRLGVEADNQRVNEVCNASVMSNLLSCMRSQCMFTYTHAPTRSSLSAPSVGQWSGAVVL